MRAPEFWNETDSAAARLLAPAGCLYALGGRLRHRLARPAVLGIPVLCVGNLVAGGAGKTPVALSVGALLRRHGVDAHYLLRGYGGVQAGPLRVDPKGHDAAAVGDEALLLAADGPTWVSRDRAAGGRAIEGAGAVAVVMDDGFQNPTLAKTVSLLVVDGDAGFGNGRVIPAGPLREPIGDGLARADTVVLLGPDRAGVTAALARRRSPPLLRARLEPECADAVAGRRVVAFAGIGRPEKLFATLREIGCTVVAERAFADHHAYTDAELAELAELADRHGAPLVTTAKDAARLTPPQRASVTVLNVRVAWTDEAALLRLLAPMLEGAT